MASLLALAWQKANGSAPAARYDNDISPVVSASSSGDTLTNQPSQDSMFDVQVPSPGTPEGFRRRKSADTIRKELNLPTKKVGWMRNSCMESQCGGGLPVLNSCGSMLSPQVSMSSFYTRSSQADTQVAKSPNLKIGEAKTAVGALLAMSDPRELNFEQDKHQKVNEESILPPRFWLEEGRAKEEDFGDDVDVGLPYDKFCDIDERRHLQSSLQDSRIATSFDNESTVHGSPSSNVLRSSRAGHRTQNTEDNTMKSSMEEVPFDKEICTYRPFAGENMMVERTAEPELDISEISNSLKDVESLQSLVDSDYVDDVQDLGTIEESSVSRRINGASRDYQKATSHRIRIQNRRRMQEDLLQSILERLQDAPDLVLEVMEGLNPRTSTLQEDSLFTGFALTNRDMICQSLYALLHDLRAITRGNMDDDLFQAVAFCLSLVKMAIPSGEKPSGLQLNSSTSNHGQSRRWKCVPGLCAELGFEEEPMSPEAAHGGDSCLFSLPSESAADTTPHTSNVSLPTTITSAFSPEKNTFQKFNRLERNSLRRSFEMVSVLFEKMSGILVDVGRLALLELPPSNEVIVGMKGAYIEMQSLDPEDLKALIDSFELDLAPLKISRLVSEDHADAPQERKNRDQMMTSDPWPILPSIVVDANVEERKDEDEEGNLYLFSPSTEDMNSIEKTIEEAEDLRRMVGSFDNSETEREERDGPPVDPRDVSRRNKKKKSMWRRRISRRNRVAE